MSPLAGSVAVGLVALAVVGWLLRRLVRRGKPPKHPYQKRALLFSADERAFFLSLKEAAAGEYEIFGKIPAAEVLVPKQGGARNPLAGWRFDFVLCDKKALAVVCAVQLRGKPGPVPDDDGLAAACASLSLPFVCFRADSSPSAEEIRAKLNAAMAKQPLYLADADGRKEPRISSLDDMRF